MTAQRSLFLGVPLGTAPVLLLVLVVLLLSSSIGPVVPQTQPHANVPFAATSSALSDVATRHPAGPTSRPAPTLAAPSTPSGPGSFFNTTNLPSAPFPAESCVAGLCYNISNDVSANLTSNGLIAAAYTTLTNESPCPAMRSTSVSNIAFVTSSDGGASWGPAKYLGNPVCTGTSGGYNDAWEPALTSLANGTLALAYVEYNLSAGELPPLTPATWPPTESRLVFTESYDNGTTWSVPQILNISNPSTAPPGLQFTPAVPSMTAFGNTLYLTWMSLTTENSLGAIALLVSTTGGATWSPTIPVSTGSGALYSMDPQVTTDSLGHVYIAYTSNVSQSSFFCGYEGCLNFNNSIWQGSVWVASSYTDGLVFNYSQVASGIPLGSPSWSALSNPVSFGPFESPAPQIVASASLGELFVAFAGGYVGNNSTNFFGTTSCFAPTAACLVDGLFFFSSFDGGATWNPGNIAPVVFNPNSINPGSNSTARNDSVTTVALATSGGTVYLEAGFYNGTDCFGGGPCGAQSEVVFSTPDGGFTFTSPTVVAAAYTPSPFAWTGEYGAVLVVNSTPEYFWTSDVCPAFASTPCSAAYPASSLPAAVVEVSSPFTGIGVNLSFAASGLGPSISWSVNVLGNVRTGSGTQTLSVSGVPTGVPIFWLVPNVYLPGYEYLLTPSVSTPSSPQTLTGNLSVSATFVEYVSVTIEYSVPNLSSIACVLDFATCPATFYPSCLGPPGSYPNVVGNFSWGCFSEYFSPVPPVGPSWVRPGSVQQIGLTPMPAWACNYPWGGFFGYVDCEGTNYTVSFGGWAGTGLGSVSTQNQNITFVPQGPVVENATFFITQVCWADFDVTGGVVFLFESYCSQFTSTLTVEEEGLPSGTNWGVSLAGSAGSGSVQTSAGAPIVNNASSIGLGTVTPWNVPSATPGQDWVGTIAGGGTLVLPHSPPVVVHYSLEPEASYAVPITVRAVGLPNGTDGNVSLTDLGTSALTQLSPSRNGTSTTVPGGTYLVNASTIQTTSGIDYLPAEVYSNVALVNESNQSGLSPFSIDVGGTATITITYVPEYWLTMSAGLGGTASPASRWVIAGQTVPLTAIPDAGYIFLHWVGRGPGATSGVAATRSQVTIQPGGPVAEFAVFEPTPTAQYTVEVTPTGLPSGQAYSVTLGTTTYSGTGSFVIGNISAGSYPLSFPNVTGVGAAISRYVETSVTGPILPGGLLSVNSNVTVGPSYETQYFVTVAAVGPGTVSAPTGGFWETAGSLLAITATPQPGSVFEQWVGAVDGGSSQLLGTSAMLQITLSGSVDLVAQFGPAPIVIPPTYTLTVNESGLPSGTPWQFAVTPGHGASGTSDSLVVAGLSGSYLLQVPTVYLGSGVRFLPTLIGSANPVIGSNTSESVSFQEEFLVSVSVSAAGQPSTTNESWVASGTSFPITAPISPVAGWAFEGWQGLGPGSYSGSAPSKTLQPSGPVSETATFAPAATSSSASVSPFDWAALGIIVAVLVSVGLAEGLLLGRRRRRPPSAAPPKAVEPATVLPPESAVVAPPAPTPPAPPPPTVPWSEGPIPDDPAWSER